MPIYGVIGVQLEVGRIARAVLRQIDPKSNSFTGSPSVMEARQITGLLAKGATVFSTVIVAGRAVHGPKLTHVVFADGAEGIDLEKNEFGHTVHDLARYDSA